MSSSEAPKCEAQCSRAAEWLRCRLVTAALDEVSTPPNRRMQWLSLRVKPRGHSTALRSSTTHGGFPRSSAHSPATPSNSRQPGQQSAAPPGRPEQPPPPHAPHSAAQQEPPSADSTPPHAPSRVAARLRGAARASGDGGQNGELTFRPSVSEPTAGDGGGGAKGGERGSLLRAAARTGTAAGAHTPAEPCTPSSPSGAADCRRLVGKFRVASGVRRAYCNSHLVGGRQPSADEDQRTCSDADDVGVTRGGVSSAARPRPGSSGGVESPWLVREDERSPVVASNAVRRKRAATVASSPTAVTSPPAVRPCSTRHSSPWPWDHIRSHLGIGRLQPRSTGSRSWIESQPLSRTTVGAGSSSGKS